MSLVSAKAALRDLAVKANAIVNDVDLTQAEKASALDLIDVDIKSANDEIALHERLAKLTTGAETGEAADVSVSGAASVKGADVHGTPLGVAASLGGQVATSAEFRAASIASKSGTRFAQSLTLAGAATTKAANVIDEGTLPNYAGGSGIAGQLVAPQFMPGIVPLRFQPLTIENLIPTGTSDSPSITYVIETSIDDATSAVPERGLKPMIDLNLGRRQDNASKIANVVKVTDELFQDAPAFESYIGNRMTWLLSRQVEMQLLNGNGTAPNMVGILNRPGLAAPVTTTAGANASKLVEGIFQQITNIRWQSFIEPDAIVMNPADWQTIRLGKDANGQYYAGGPFTGAYGNAGPSNVYQLWGMPVVVTSAIAQGTALVGAFREGAQQFIRQGLTLEMTNSNEDDFKTNLIALRAETRRILAVYLPQGFGKVVFTA